MFGDLSKLETFKIGGTKVRTTDALAVGMIGWGAWRWWIRKEELATAETPEAKNKIVPLENQAQQDLYKLVLVGAALIVLPRMLF